MLYLLIGCLSFAAGFVVGGMWFFCTTKKWRAAPSKLTADKQR